MMEQNGIEDLGDDNPELSVHVHNSSVAGGGVGCSLTTAPESSASTVVVVTESNGSQQLEGEDASAASNDDILDNETSGMASSANDQSDASSERNVLQIVSDVTGLDLEAMIAHQREVAQRLEFERTQFLQRMALAEAEVYRMAEQIYGAVDNRTNELLSTAASLRSDHMAELEKTRSQMESSVASMLSYQQVAERLVNHGTAEDLVHYGPVLHQIGEQLTSAADCDVSQLTAGLEADERMADLQAFANLNLAELTRRAGGNLVGNMTTSQQVDPSGTTTYLANAILLSDVPGGNGVRGLTMLSNKLFVIRERSSVIEVFDVTNGCVSVRLINVEQLTFPDCIVGSEDHNCLFISDVQVNGVFLIQFDNGADDDVTFIPLDSVPSGLSVKPGGLLIVTFPETKVIGLLSIDTKLLLQDVPVGELCHPLLAVPVNGDDNGFVVCDESGSGFSWFLCGHRFEGMARALESPVQLRTLSGVNSLVPDMFGTYLAVSESRDDVELLDSTFAFVRHILSAEANLSKPTSVALNKHNGRLAVGQRDGSVKLFQVLPTREHIRLNLLSWS